MDFKMEGGSDQRRPVPALERPEYVGHGVSVPVEPFTMGDVLSSVPRNPVVTSIALSWPEVLRYSATRMAKRHEKRKEKVLEPEVIGPSNEVPDEPMPALELSSSEEGKADTTAVVPVTALQQYLAEIRRHPYLSKEEELRLFEEYRTYGSRDAAVKLIMANLRVSVAIAAEYLHTG